MRRAIVSTIASDSHTWNLVYLQLLLEEHGFSVTNTGACCPVDELVAECIRVRPDLVVLSTVNGHGLIEAPGYARAFADHVLLRDVVMVIGGKLGIGGQPREKDIHALVRWGFADVFVTDRAVEEFRVFLSGFSTATAA